MITKQRREVIWTDNRFSISYTKPEPPSFSPDVCLEIDGVEKFFFSLFQLQALIRVANEAERFLLLSNDEKEQY